MQGGGADRPLVSLIIGVGQVSLYLRHARTLKDKRNVLKSIIERLRNMGFTVTECAYQEEARQGSLGFAYVGATTDAVQQALEKGMRFFIGDFEIVSTHTDIFDYSDRETAEFKQSDDEDEY